MPTQFSIKERLNSAVVIQPIELKVIKLKQNNVVKSVIQSDNITKVIYTEYSDRKGVKVLKI